MLTLWARVKHHIEVEDVDRFPNFPAKRAAFEFVDLDRFSGLLLVPGVSPFRHLQKNGHITHDGSDAKQSMNRSTQANFRQDRIICRASAMQAVCSNRRDRAQNPFESQMYIAHCNGQEYKRKGMCFLSMPGFTCCAVSDPRENIPMIGYRHYSDTRKYSDDWIRPSCMHKVFFPHTTE